MADKHNSAGKVPYGSIKRADVITAATSSMGPRDYSGGYPPTPTEVMSSDYTRVKRTPYRKAGT